MTAQEQVVRHVRVGDRTVAWVSLGSGPPLVIGGWWAGHLALEWEDDAFRAFVEELARRHTVIRYDRPGSGLSDHDEPPPVRLADEVAVLAGLIERLGLTTTSVLGASSGSGVAAAFTAQHPERVDRLVLYGSYPRGADIAPASARDLMLSAVRTHWGLGARMLSDVFLPNATAQERERFARFQHRAATPDAAAAALAAVYARDATADLSRVRVPTLVLHRRGDRAIPFALGRAVADLVPGATFVELAGDDHFPWRGDAAAVIDAIERFLSGRPPQTRRPSAPAPALTAREREVLALVAAGLTDVQIAERLVLSPHSIHRHVANARVKLGVPTRAAAAAWVSAHPAPDPTG